MPKLPIGDIGPCEVWWGYGYQSGDMPLIITPYLGKVTLRIVDTVTDIHENGKGVAPIDAFFEGTTVELEVPMTRSTLIQLAQTIGWQKMGDLSGSVLRLDNIAGEEMYAYAETMVIKPLCNNVPDPDPHHWTMLYKCHPYRDIELGFDRSGQRIHLVKFKVFPSRDSGYEGEGGGGQYLQEGMKEIPDFVVNDSNKYLDFYEIANAGGLYTATMTEGGYSGNELAAEIETKMNDVADHYNFVVSYSDVTHKFSITNIPGWWPFDLRWKTGPHGSNNLDDHIGTLLGFDDSADDTGAGPHISDWEVP